MKQGEFRDTQFRLQQSFIRCVLVRDKCFSASAELYSNNPEATFPPCYKSSHNADCNLC